MRVIEEMEPEIQRVEPVLQVVEHFGLKVELDGQELKALCPFHDEQTPSFGINLISGLWHCFGCGRGGNLELLAMALGQLERLKAKILIRRLRGKPAGAIEGLDGLDLTQLEKEPISYDVNEVWSRFHRVNWMHVSLSVPAASYLIKERGFTRSTLEAFDVRFSERAEYPIVIPIRRSSELMGYVYRRIDAGKKKYLFNSGFSLETSLAYYRVGDEPCIVTEGMLDLMLCAQYGARHGASILTWQIKQPQADWLKSIGVKEVICATDNTPTGDEGYRDMVAMLNGLAVYRFKFPGEYRKDVGELNVNEFAKSFMDSYPT